ncbi:hypothetical protein JKP88DRAFT_346468 [Tribonema minus]|uniref:Potassium channel tetramerisation-type BTB domain-containing protein n=1 Tax=Tribonema minus TaxID=303371 RepID=A0A835ZG58_9STRA|nr:hypothetical protein JKP88DRAFT_346468 [Tribonema minus]
MSNACASPDNTRTPTAATAALLRAAAASGGCLLAALCRGGGGGAAPLENDPASGAFFLDRDWWVFRYVLQFLRSGALPHDAALLREMHEEAAFYRLDTLRRAIAGRMESAATAQQQRHHCSSKPGGATMLETSPIRAYGGPSWATTQRGDAHYLDDYGRSGGAVGGGHWRDGGSGGAELRTQARTPLPDPPSLLPQSSIPCHQCRLCLSAAAATAPPFFAPPAPLRDSDVTVPTLHAGSLTDERFSHAASTMIASFTADV